MKPIVYAITNQKGGCGKTTLILSLGVVLSKRGKKLLLVDLDPQANMTMALGHHSPDELPVAIAQILKEIINANMKPEQSKMIVNRDYILKSQGLHFIPSNIDLAAIENILTNTMSRENVLKKLLNYIKSDYDVIIIDCMPSLNFTTINALVAVDNVLIPLQPQFFLLRVLKCC